MVLFAEVNETPVERVGKRKLKMENGKKRGHPAILYVFVLP